MIVPRVLLEQGTWSMEGQGKGAKCKQTRGRGQPITGITIISSE